MKPRQRESEDGPGQSGVRVLTVALFIILLAFFIVLNSIAVIDESRMLKAIGSLIGSFGILPGGLSPMKEKGKGVSPPQPPMAFYKMETTEIFGLDMPSSKLVSIRPTPKGDVISIQDRVIFDEESYKIKPSSYAFLKRLCEAINQDEYPVEITGHTDSRSPDEKPVGSNWELSSLKALEVLRFFVVIGKVHPARLTAYGCGEYKPIASNDTRQTRAQNRRVDIILDQRSREKLKQIYQKGRSRFFVFKKFVFSIFD